MGFTPIRSDWCRDGGMSWPDAHGRPLREDLGTATVEFPVNDSLAGLTPLDLVVEVVEHRPYDYVEADLAEAVRTGLVHGLLQSAARSRGFGVPKARLGL
jgi:hypothetical protein